MADKKKEKPEEEKDEKTEGAAEGAEGEAGGEDAAAGGKKKPPMKLIIMIVVGLVVLLGGAGAALYFTGMLGGKEKAKTEDAADHGKEEAKKDDGHGGKDEKKDKKEGSVFYDLGEIMVNISGEGRRQTYLRLVVQLELENEKDKAAMENLKPRIVDNFQTYLRELRLDDLRGSGGLYRLREELLFRVTDAVHPIKVKDVLFQQMLVQ